MRPVILSTVLFAVVALAVFPALAQQAASEKPNFAFLIKFGLKDKQPTKWDGSVTVTPGKVLGVEGWHFDKGDTINDASSWQCSTHREDQRQLRPDEIVRLGGKPQPPPPILICGVIVSVNAPAAGLADVTTPAGKFQVKLNDLKWGAKLAQLDGAVTVERVPIVEKIGQTGRYEDWVSLALASDGSLCAAMTSYANEADEVVLRVCDATGAWGAPLQLTSAPGDNFETQAATAGDGSVWVVWSSQVNGNWDLYGRSLSGGKLGPIERLTNTPGPDIYHCLIAAPDGRLCLAWQSARNGQFDIYLRLLERGKWAEEVQVSESPANDWEPAVAAAADGTIYIAWDSYHTGNYDVYLRSMKGGQLSAIQPLTQSPAFQAHVSLAADPQGRAWVVWDRSEANWGKDQGFYWRVNNRTVGSALHSNRFIELVCFDPGGPKQPEAYIGALFPQGAPSRMNELPQVHFDSQGRLWLSYRRLSRKQQGASGGGNRGLWDDYLAYWDGQKWAADILVPHTTGRQDQRLAMLPDATGGMRLAWACDERPFINPRPLENEAYVSYITADPGPTGLPPLTSYQPPEVTPPGPADPDEAADIARIRAARATAGGKTFRILRGDTHRHTDISADGSGDGSQYEMYRYALDSCGLDWVSIGDHDNGWGEGQEYSWWCTQKACDLFYIDGVFEPLFGYERSNGWPHGHRNVTNAKRGARVVQRLREGNKLSDNDTKNLYAELRKQGGICFSHTSGTNGMGTDWRDNDPEIEPVVEIFQGCRTSYEYVGAPLAATEDRVDLQAGGFDRRGYVWEAWAKGYRLGVIASSDHGSTHISFASVWAEDFTRDGIVNAIRARRTFGATDNIVMKFWADDHFMGEEFTATQPPKMRIEIEGTGEIARVDIIKNNTFVYTNDPAGSSCSFTYADNKITPGTSYYYVRVVQEDTNVAWSSPIWLNYRAGFTPVGAVTGRLGD